MKALCSTALRLLNKFVHRVKFDSKKPDEAKASSGFFLQRQQDGKFFGANWLGISCFCSFTCKIEAKRVSCFASTSLPKNLTNVLFSQLIKPVTSLKVFSAGSKVYIFFGPPGITPIESSLLLTSSGVKGRLG